MKKKYSNDWIISVLFALSILLVFNSAVTAQSQDERITYGVLYKHNLERKQNNYQRLKAYLEENKFSVNFQFFQDPGDIEVLINKMKNGEIDVAGEIPPFDYLRFKKVVKPFARSIWNGRDFYYSVIVAKKDANIRTILDLRGKLIALTNPDSASGFIYPRSLIYENNLDLVLKDATTNGKSSNTVYYNNYANYKNVLDALSDNGGVVAGAMPEFSFKNKLRNDPDICSSLVVLSDGRSPIKNGVFVSRRDFPNEILKRFRDTLIELTENHPPDFFDEWNGFQGWIPWNENDYDVLTKTQNAPSPTQKLLFKSILIFAVILFIVSAVLVKKFWLSPRSKEI